MSWAAQGINCQLMTCYEQSISVNSHHMQQVSSTCACIGFWHIFCLHFVPVHIGHRACLYSQLMQCLVSWETQQVNFVKHPNMLALCLKEIVIQQQRQHLLSSSLSSLLRPVSCSCYVSAHLNYASSGTILESSCILFTQVHAQL